MSPLRRRMIDDMQIRNLAPDTQRSYLQQISQFARHFGKSPDLLGPDDIRTYQIHLTQDRQLSASSILVAVAAIRFLYKITLKRHWSIEEVIPTCRKPQTLPVILSQEEVRLFLNAVENLKHRVILTLCYAAGLRISEAVRLTPKAIDNQRMVIRVEAGKGPRSFDSNYFECAISEDAVEVHGVAPESVGDILDLVEAEDVEGEAAQDREDGWAFPNAACILVHRHIEHVVNTALNAPVAACHPGIVFGTLAFLG